MKKTLFFLVFLGLFLLNCTAPDQLDTEAPVLTFLPSNDTLYIGDSWKEPGYACVDNVDGDISSIAISGSVNTERIGKYILTYSASDKAGNSSSAERTVYVLSAPDLWAFYPFNGTTNDSSISSRHCEQQGIDFTIDRFGDKNMAAGFSAAGAIVKRTGLEKFPAGNCAKSICGWFRSTSTDAVQGLFGIGKTLSQYNFTIVRGPAGTKNQFRINGWGDNYDWRTGVDAAPYFDGAWHCCAVTYDSIATKFYLDGELKGETNTFRFLTDPEKSLVIFGMEIDLKGWQFKGAMDDVRIYSRALTPLQVKALFLEKEWNGKSPADTTKRDTTTTPDTSSLKPTKIELSYEITGSGSSLQMVLRWNNVASAFSYGIYYKEGTTVSKNDYYRIAVSNSKTFTSELATGSTYTFAVVTIDGNGTESVLSAPLTVLFSPQ
jgi:hypothetical protein